MKFWTFIFLYLFEFYAQADRYQDIMLPKSVLDLIRSEYSLTKDKPLKIEFVDTKIELKGSGLKLEKTISRQQPIWDLADAVSAKNKNFKFNLKLGGDEKLTSHIVFINQYQPQDVGNSTLGVPCGTALVFKAKAQEFASSGVAISNRDGQYIHIIGGDYLLTNLVGSTLKIGFVRVRDGRFLPQLCKMGV